MTLGIWTILLVLAAALAQPASATVIYVDADATGDENGSSWCDAYTDVNDALDAASSGDDIWVAQGTYDAPNDTPGWAGFVLVSDVNLYGGYAGCGETDPNQRDWVNNVTTLTGENANLSSVVCANDVTGVIIDGFTITDAYAGIASCDSSLTIRYCNITRSSGGIDLACQSSATVQHCQISNNLTGIYHGDLSTATVANCEISHNKFNGIYCDLVGVEDLWVRNCEIHDNGSEGIVADANDSVVIKNNLIHHNSEGIFLLYADSNCIRNNTITDNTGYGIKSYDYMTAEVTNCIVWGNHGGALDPNAGGSYRMRYSCTETCSDANDCNDPNDCNDANCIQNICDDPCFVHYFDFSDITTDGGDYNSIVVGNASRYSAGPPAHVIEYDNDGVPRTVTDIDTSSNIVAFDPCLAAFSQTGILIHNWGPNETDVNEDYHLLGASNCVDTGYPCASYAGETDIDGEARVMKGHADADMIVDIGADEYNSCWNCPTQCHGDADCQDDVDLADMFILKQAFGTGIGDPNYDNCADFDRDGSVNLADMFILKANFGTDPDDDCPGT
jgi:parallel beta-helix repeat protein